MKPYVSKFESLITRGTPGEIANRYYGMHKGESDPARIQLLRNHEEHWRKIQWNIDQNLTQ